MESRKEAAAAGVVIGLLIYSLSGVGLYFYHGDPNGEPALPFHVAGLVSAAIGAAVIPAVYRLRRKGRNAIQYRDPYWRCLRRRRHRAKTAKQEE